MTAARSVDEVTGDLADLACEVATDRNPTVHDVTRLRALVDELAATVAPAEAWSGDPEDPEWCEIGVHRLDAPGPCPTCARLLEETGVTMAQLEAAAAEAVCLGSTLEATLAAAPTVDEDQP